MKREKINITVSPEGSLEVLSHHEVERLKDKSHNHVHELLRRCSLAVLNCGAETDDAEQIFDTFSDFDIHLIQNDWGLQLKLINAPASAFINNEMIIGIKEHLFSVLRDIVYVAGQIEQADSEELISESGITDAVFYILRNAKVLNSRSRPNLVVCWGGHAIDQMEYAYTKKIGYEMGLHGLDICTGCGPGAMKGPMKGALLGHFKQRIFDGKFLGFTEPGIIAAEPPNPIVNGLVILPDIEKRLEAFIRAAHTIIVFPGGPGSMEEILCLLGILLHPDNHEIPIPLILTGPVESKSYFQMIHDFIGATLGFEAQQLYKIILANPKQVAATAKQSVDEIKLKRKALGDSFFFNWQLKIDQNFTIPFSPTHKNMAGIELRKDLPPAVLAANLRKAFSGIVAGNVKSNGIQAVEKYGPFELNGDPEIIEPLEKLLSSLVAKGRMKLHGSKYEPCYRVAA